MILLLLEVTHVDVNVSPTKQRKEIIERDNSFRKIGEIQSFYFNFRATWHLDDNNHAWRYMILLDADITWIKILCIFIIFFSSFFYHCSL